MRVSGELVRLARPKQWAKNLLVFAAPGAAGVLLRPAILLAVLLAFLSFSFVASGMYCLNDVRDAEADRGHLRKRLRPVAAGTIGRRSAVVVGAAFTLVGLSIAWVVGPDFFGSVVLYLALTSLYSFRLKRAAIIELALVASGFLIRAIAGGFAVHVPISNWFLIVTGFGSLFVVAGKRHGELALHEGSTLTRHSLAAYPQRYLRYVWTLSSTVCVAAYVLWSFEQSSAHRDSGLYLLSIIPFTMTVLRYALLLDTGHGDEPEAVVLADRPLLGVALCWLITFAIAVYLGR